MVGAIGGDGREGAGGWADHAVGRSERTDGADRRQSRAGRLGAGDRRSVRGRLGGGEAAGRLVGERRDNRAALLEPRLARQQLVQLALERALIEQLPPSDPVEVGARFGDAVLVGVLLFRLARGEGGEHVVVKDEVNRRQSRPNERQGGEGRKRPQDERTHCD
jgi:hypothetical protein